MFALRKYDHQVGTCRLSTYLNVILTSGPYKPTCNEWTLVILTKCFGVGVSCRNLYSFLVYLYVNGSGSITSVGEGRES